MPPTCPIRHDLGQFRSYVADETGVYVVYLQDQEEEPTIPISSLEALTLKPQFGRTLGSVRVGLRLGRSRRRGVSCHLRLHLQNKSSPAPSRHISALEIFSVFRALFP